MREALALRLDLVESRVQVKAGCSGSASGRRRQVPWVQRVLGMPALPSACVCARALSCVGGSARRQEGEAGLPSPQRPRRWGGRRGPRRLQRLRMSRDAAAVRRGRASDGAKCGPGSDGGGRRRPGSPRLARGSFPGPGALRSVYLSPAKHPDGAICTPRFTEGDSERGVGAPRQAAGASAFSPGSLPPASPPWGFVQGRAGGVLCKQSQRRLRGLKIALGARITRGFPGARSSVSRAAEAAVGATRRALWAAGLDATLVPRLFATSSFGSPSVFLPRRGLARTSELLCSEILISSCVEACTRFLREEFLVGRRPVIHTAFPPHPHPHTHKKVFKNPAVTAFR